MKKFVAVLILLNVVLMSLYIYDKVSSPKTGYILIQEVFNGFELKKDYEKKLNATKTSRQNIIDSLELDLKMLGRKIESDKGKNKEDITTFNIKRENYFQKKKMFDEDNQALTKKYDEEIITQLNQYVKDYGKEHEYTYIYGSDGNGSLMYAEEAKNLTKDITEYVNGKFRGER
jgi:outer membrane protein